MDATSCPPSNPRSADGSARRGVMCPFCDGVLVPLGGTYRCLRCAFSICPGCESPEPPTYRAVTG